MRTPYRIGFMLALLGMLFAIPAHAFSFDNHTGSYLYAMGGFMTLTDDANQRTVPPTKFGGTIVPAFGLTYGHNITDWIAPEIQFVYATASGLTPGGAAREHALTIRINAKYSFLTNWERNKNKEAWKLFPYVKAGGLVHALYVNAPVATDKVGAYGGGAGFGGGLEVNWKALYLGLDISNDLVFLQSVTKTVAGTPTQIIAGGFNYQFSLMGAVGVHF